MIKVPSIFKRFAQVFKDHGYRVFLIGGSSRDLLLKKEFKDYDVATDATPEQVKAMFEDVFDKYAIYGSVKVNFENVNFDVTTFRREKNYGDHRHPASIEFVKDMDIDYRRRDFTINALYVDLDGNIYDYGSGRDDLHYHLIRIIGDPNKRLVEDPLRILRAIRFSLVLDFEIEESLQFAMARNAHLVSTLNPDKIRQEIVKMQKEGIPNIYIKGQLSSFHVVLPFKID